MAKLATITLAAGKGTRMKSKLPKVLHKVAGKSMVQHAVDAVKELNPVYNSVVVGYKGDLVKEKTEGKLDFIRQEEQLGTGHAVEQTKPLLGEFDGTILVIYGDTPLLTTSTLEELVEKHEKRSAAATILTTEVEDPSGYGRIVRDSEGQVARIVEDKDTTDQEAKIKEINTGICCFDSQLLWSTLGEVTPDNAQEEYYLTDVPEILAKKGNLVTALVTANSQETVGVNTRKHLAEAESILRRRICEQHLEAGVTIIDPENTYIDSSVEIGQDSIIYPFTFLEGDTKLGKEVVVGPQTRIIDSVLESEVEVEQSTIIDSEIGSETTVGPYAYIRPGTQIGKQAKIGDFVEIKKSTVADNSKVPHLSYIGDTKIGSETNIGAGTITANYDGTNKYETIIEDKVFIGSNSTLVSPLKIGTEAVTGAGAVVTKDVEPQSTVVGVPAEKLDKNK